MCIIIDCSFWARVHSKCPVSVGYIAAVVYIVGTGDDCLESYGNGCRVVWLEGESYYSV